MPADAPDDALLDDAALDGLWNEALDSLETPTANTPSPLLEWHDIEQMMDGYVTPDLDDANSEDLDEVLLVETAEPSGVKRDKNKRRVAELNRLSKFGIVKRKVDGKHNRFVYVSSTRTLTSQKAAMALCKAIEKEEKAQQ